MSVLLTHRRRVWALVALLLATLLTLAFTWADATTAIGNAAPSQRLPTADNQVPLAVCEPPVIAREARFVTSAPILPTNPQTLDNPSSTFMGVPIPGARLTVDGGMTIHLAFAPSGTKAIPPQGVAVAYQLTNGKAGNQEKRFVLRVTDDALRAVFLNAPANRSEFDEQIDLLDPASPSVDAVIDVSPDTTTFTVTLANGFSTTFTAPTPLRDADGVIDNRFNLAPGHSVTIDTFVFSGNTLVEVLVPQGGDSGQVVASKVIHSEAAPAVLSNDSASAYAQKDVAGGRITVQGDVRFSFSLQAPDTSNPPGSGATVGLDITNGLRGKEERRIEVGRQVRQGDPGYNLVLIYREDDQTKINRILRERIGPSVVGSVRIGCDGRTASVSLSDGAEVALAVPNSVLGRDGLVELRFIMAPQSKATITGLEIRGGFTDLSTPGTVLLADRFDDPAAGRLPNSSRDPRSSTSRADGEYVIKKLAVGNDFLSIAETPESFTDVSAAVDVRLVGQTDGRWVHVACRMLSGGWGGYYLAVNPRAGEFRLGSWDGRDTARGGRGDRQFARSISDAIRRGNEPNHLELTCAGQNLIASVNGKLVAAAQDDQFQSGPVALAAAADGLVEARYDNLVVTQANPSQPLPPPPGPPAPGTLLLSDNFDSPDVGWLPTSSRAPTAFEAGYVGGEYVVRVVQLRYSAVSSIPGTYSDTSLAVDVRLVGDSRGRGFSLRCRSDEFGASYGLAVVPDTQVFELRRYTKDGFRWLAGQRGSPAIRTGNQTNRFELICAGNVVAAVINGRVVAEVPDATYKSGGMFISVGFSDTEAGSTEAHFDNLVITQR